MLAIFNLERSQMISKKVFGAFAVALVALGTIGSAMAQDNTLLIWADAERTPLLVELAETVESELGITLDVREIGLGDARDQLLTAGPVGEGPDLLVTAHDSIGLFVENGAIIPLELDDMMTAEFSVSSLQLFTYENQVWGLPYAQENVAVIRNVDLAPEPFATWADVRALSETLAAESKFAMAIPTGNTYHNFPVTSSFGGYIFGLNEDGSFNVADIGLASEGGLAAAEWLGGMYTEGLLPTDVNDDVMFSLFEEGNTAALITGPWFSQRIIDTGINYAIDPIPGVEGVTVNGSPFSGGQGFVISAFSEKQLLAEAFLYDFLATVEFQQAVFDAGGRPPAFIAVDTSSNPNIAGFVAAGANAIPMPAIPEMGSVWGASDAALTLISRGEDPVASMETAVQQISDSIDLAASGALASVTLVGSLQSEAGCPEDWNPACETTFMTDEDGDGVWTFVATLPAGDYEFKVAINGDWAENYGADGAADGANIALSLAAETEVTFTYDRATNLITDSVNN
jgi:arabinogalactan oligomer / maltooligosaccharide transport system substrate-binding protein